MIGKLINKEGKWSVDYRVIWLDEDSMYNATHTTYPLHPNNYPKTLGDSDIAEGSEVEFELVNRSEGNHSAETDMTYAKLISSKQEDWKPETKLLMEAYGDNPNDFPYIQEDCVTCEYPLNNCQCSKNKERLSKFKEKYLHKQEEPKETWDEIFKKYKDSFANHGSIHFMFNWLKEHYNTPQKR